MYIKGTTSILFQFGTECNLRQTFVSKAYRLRLYALSAQGDPRQVTSGGGIQVQPV